MAAINGMFFNNVLVMFFCFRKPLSVFKYNNSFNLRKIRAFVPYTFFIIHLTLDQYVSSCRAVIIQFDI